jgi:hypothetical protein
LDKDAGYGTAEFVELTMQLKFPEYPCVGSLSLITITHNPRFFKQNQVATFFVCL